MREHDAVRLRHMLDESHEVVGFVRGLTRADLDGDRKLVLALVKAIEISGEAAYQVSQTSRDRMPDIPWEDIIGMRHRLVHAYFDINLDILWQTVKVDLPPLILVLEKVIPHRFGKT